MKNQVKIKTNLSVVMLWIGTMLLQSCNANTNSGSTKNAAIAEKTNAKTLKLKLTAVVDNEITKGDAIIFFIPDGWKHNSRINWDFSNNVYPSNPEAYISSANGSAQYNSYPTQYFILASQTMNMSGFGPGAKYLGSKVVASMPSSTTQAADEVLQSLNCLPKGTIITQTKAVKVPITNPQDQLAINANPGVSVISDNIYTEGTFTQNGEKYTIACYTMVSGMVNKSIGFATWSIRPDVFIIKEDSQKEENKELLTAIYKSFRATKNYQNCVVQVSQMLSNNFYTSVRNAGEISRQISRNNDAMIAGIEAQYQQANSSSSSSPSGSGGFNDYIKGVDNYTDNNGYKYELPSSYNHAWKSGNGEIILTNETGYDPNVGSTQTWQELNK